MSATIHSLFSPNRDTILAHVGRLFSRVAVEAPDARCEIMCIHPTRKAGDNRLERKARMFPIDGAGMQAATEWAAAENAAGWNLYIGVNPRRAGAMNKHAADDAVLPLAHFYFIDGDSAETAKRVLENCPIPYTFAVVTGRTPHARPQVYWEMEEPTQNMRAWSQQQKALAHWFAGDSVTDPPRVMRLAGTVNYPTDKKTGRGYVTEMVTLHFHNDDEMRRPVTPSEMTLFFPALAETATATGPTLNLDGFAGPKVEPMHCIDEIRAGKNLHNNTRDLINHMVGAGYADWAIVQLTRQIVFPVSDGGTLSEIPDLLLSARARFGKPNPQEKPFTSDPVPVAPEPEIVYASEFLTAPPERKWAIPGWLPAGEVTSLYGDGGVGKTLLAQQMATSIATGMAFMRQSVEKIPVLAVLCEDTKDELHRRQFAITNSLLGHLLTGLKTFGMWPRVGAENFMVLYDPKGSHTLTPFYHSLMEKIAAIQGPKLLILDTLADLFGGNEIVRKEVNHFIKTVLGRLVRDYEATILILAHPSLSGMNSGAGFSGSTAWNNAVRQRLFLTRVEGDTSGNERVLTRMKSNYAKAGPDEKIEMTYCEGVFQQPPPDLIAERAEQARWEQLILGAVDKGWATGRPWSNSQKAGDLSIVNVLRRKEFRLLRRDELFATVEAMIEGNRLILLKHERRWCLQRPSSEPRARQETQSDQ